MVKSFDFFFCLASRSSSSILPRKELQAVKAVLQGTTSQHHQQHRQHLQKQSQQEQSHRGDSNTAASSSPRKDTLTKKRNLFEVFKKPSSSKEAEKLQTAERTSHVVDKSELEYIETLKVRAAGAFDFPFLNFFKKIFKINSFACSN